MDLKIIPNSSLAFIDIGKVIPASPRLIPSHAPRGPLRSAHQPTSCLRSAAAPFLQAVIAVSKLWVIVSMRVVLASTSSLFSALFSVCIVYMYSILLESIRDSPN